MHKNGLSFAFIHRAHARERKGFAFELRSAEAAIGRMPVSEKALLSSSTQCGSCDRAHARERKGFAFELRSAEAAIGRMPVSEKAKN